MGQQWEQWKTLFPWAPNSLKMVTATMKLRHLFLERKAMTNLDSILKSRDSALAPKVHLVKAMVFPVVMYGCERWSIKKAERRRIDAFELWCWRRLLRVPWTARKYNHSILKEISPSVHWRDWCWSWNSNILATSCEELTYWKRPWCWEGLGAGGERDDRGWDGWMASPTQWTWVWVSSGSWWWTGRPGVLRFMGSQRLGHDCATELNWSEWLFCLTPVTVWWDLFLTVWKLLSYQWLFKLLWVPQPPPTIIWGPWIRDPQYEG